MIDTLISILVSIIPYEYTNCQDDAFYLILAKKSFKYCRLRKVSGPDR